MEDSLDVDGVCGEDLLDVVVVILHLGKDTRREPVVLTPLPPGGYADDGPLLGGPVLAAERAAGVAVPDHLALLHVLQLRPPEAGAQHPGVNLAEARWVLYYVGMYVLCTTLCT